MNNIGENHARMFVSDYVLVNIYDCHKLKTIIRVQKKLIFYGKGNTNTKHIYVKK